MLKTFLLTFFVVSLAFLQGSPSYNDAERLLRNILQGNGALPTDAELFSAMGTEEKELSSNEVRLLLPLARQILHDGRSKAAELGLKVFLAVALRSSMDSAELLSPYFPDLEQIVTTRRDYEKSLAIKVLVLVRPRLPDELLKFLSSHLEDATTSDEDARQLAVALAQSGNAAFLHQAIQFAPLRKGSYIAATIVQVLGSMQTNDPEGLSLIDSSLDSADPGLRGQAVTAVWHLPQIRRVRFLAKLNRIASDPQETEAIRSLARQALSR